MQVVHPNDYEYQNNYGTVLQDQMRKAFLGVLPLNTLE